LYVVLDSPKEGDICLLFFAPQPMWVLFNKIHDNTYATGSAILKSNGCMTLIIQNPDMWPLALTGKKRKSQGA
jgi:hypothetical protein